MRRRCVWGGGAEGGSRRGARGMHWVGGCQDVRRARPRESRERQLPVWAGLIECSQLPAATFGSCKVPGHSFSQCLWATTLSKCLGSMRHSASSLGALWGSVTGAEGTHNSKALIMRRSCLASGATSLCLPAAMCLGRSLCEHSVPPCPASLQPKQRFSL